MSIRTVELCAFCRRTEPHCTCEGAYEPVTIELDSTQQLSRGGTVQRRSAAARPRAGRAQPRRSPVERARPPQVNEEVRIHPVTWMQAAQQALDTATPENLAGPHRQVGGVWFTYVRGSGWMFTTDT